METTLDVAPIIEQSLRAARGMTAGPSLTAERTSPVQPIHVKRFQNDPTCQGSVEPEDRSWQVVIDDKGFPHLYVRVKVEENDGAISHGMLALDDMLPEGTTIEHLMTDAVALKTTPEESDAAYEVFKAQCEAGTRPPCPR